MNRVFIIAEVGVNHNGEMDLAFELINKAQEAGADAVKFQVAIPEMVATSLATKATYQKNNTSNSSDTQLEMIRSLLIPLESFYKISSYCERLGITFFATAFDLHSLAFINMLGQPYHKVPSGEITNLPYLRQIGSYKKPVFLSTGMSKLGEIESAIAILESSGTPRQLITALHCTTEYPAPFSEVNLSAMQTIRKAFGVEVGYSDHTEGVAASIAATALGAVVIEKHLTLDRSMNGPDHLASLEPSTFADMVSGIRSIELALGDGIKWPTPSEYANISIVRRSLVASKPIKSGEVFTIDNLAAKRPATGISPMEWDSFLGRTASRDYSVDDLIER